MSSKSKKVLVTGVAGFLGSHLCKKLHDNKITNGIDRVQKNNPVHYTLVNGACRYG